MAEPRSNDGAALTLTLFDSAPARALGRPDVDEKLKFATAEEWLYRPDGASVSGELDLRTDLERLLERQMSRRDHLGAAEELITVSERHFRSDRDTRGLRLA